MSTLLDVPTEVWQLIWVPAAVDRKIGGVTGSTHQRGRMLLDGSARNRSGASSGQVATRGEACVLAEWHYHEMKALSRIIER